MSINERIKERRIALGLSQEELAQRLGYKTKSSIAKIERANNDFPQHKISKFAAALETTEAWLMGYDVPMERIAIKSGLVVGQIMHSSNAQNLKRAREQANFSIEEAARILKIDRVVIEEFENAHVELKLGNSILEEMCRLYHVTPYEIIDNYDSDAAPDDAGMKFVLFGCSNAPDSLLDNVREYASFLFEQHKKANGYSE